MTRIRLPRRWAQAAVLFAAAGVGPLLSAASTAVADPYGSQADGYCTGDSCGTCDDDTWWERTCGFCRERTDHFRSLRRKWYWKNNDRHITTMYPETSPFCSPTHGYFQTCWRPFPYECPRCPQYVISPASSPSAIPPGAPPMELGPATDAAQPGASPGATEPYFPQPAPPPDAEQTPAPEAALPVVPPQSLDIDRDGAISSGLLQLGPIDEVFADDEGAPDHPQTARLTRIESRTQPGALGELQVRQQPPQFRRLVSAGTHSAGLRDMRPLEEVFTEDGWTPQSERPRRLVNIGFESVD